MPMRRSRSKQAASKAEQTTKKPRVAEAAPTTDAAAAAWNPLQILTVELLEECLEMLPDQASALLQKLNHPDISIRTISDLMAVAKTGFEYDAANKDWTVIGKLKGVGLAPVEIEKLHNFYVEHAPAGSGKHALRLSCERDD